MEEEKTNSAQTKEANFVEPCNIKTIWWRLPELITDPVCNQLSASRFVFFWVGILCGFIAIWETLHGKAATITTMISTVAATASGVYFASTVKDWRWRKQHKEDVEEARQECREEKERQEGEER